MFPALKSVGNCNVCGIGVALVILGMVSYFAPNILAMLGHVGSSVSLLSLPEYLDSGLTRERGGCWSWGMSISSQLVPPDTLWR